jgi:hypothetical protein
MINNIPVSQLQIGDTVLYKTGAGRKIKDRYHRVKDIKDLHNGTKRLLLDKRQEMIVLNHGEVTIFFE